jgi:hypothetical protein
MMRTITDVIIQALKDTECDTNMWSDASRRKLAEEIVKALLYALVDGGRSVP